MVIRKTLKNACLMSIRIERMFKFFSISVSTVQSVVCINVENSLSNISKGVQNRICLDLILAVVIFF